MMSSCRSDRVRAAKGGFTLLEVLVVLAIIVGVTGIAASAIRGPSPRLKLDARVSEIIDEASTARHRAVVSQQEASFSVTDCAGQVREMKFFQDGSAQTMTLCVAVGELSQMLSVSPITGRVVVSDSR